MRVTLTDSTFWCYRHDSLHLNAGRIEPRRTQLRRTWLDPDLSPHCKNLQVSSGASAGCQLGLPHPQSLPPPRVPVGILAARRCAFKREDGCGCGCGFTFQGVLCQDRAPCPSDSPHPGWVWLPRLATPQTIASSSLFFFLVRPGRCWGWKGSRFRVVWRQQGQPHRVSTRFSSWTADYLRLVQ